jgi:hypothetical protein
MAKAGAVARKRSGGQEAVREEGAGQCAVCWQGGSSAQRCDECTAVTSTVRCAERVLLRLTRVKVRAKE